MDKNTGDENRYRRKLRKRRVSDRPVGEEERFFSGMDAGFEEIPAEFREMADGMEEIYETFAQQTATKEAVVQRRRGKSGEQPREPENRGNGQGGARKEILVDFVVDGTFSFTKVFPRVYYAIERVIRSFEQAKREYRGVEIRYGLTIFRETAEPCVFSNESEFTADRQEFLQALRGVVFAGGSPDGRENLTSALDTALRSLNNEGGKSAYRGLLLFSDSLPADKEPEPFFLEEFQSGYLNRGLRFAVLYTYDDSFVPALKMVDRDGRPTENEKNFVSCNSLQDLLRSNGKEAMEKLQQIVDSMLNQVSV